jgi:hypothetical protein
VTGGQVEEICRHQVPKDLHDLGHRPLGPNA